MKKKQKQNKETFFFLKKKRKPRKKYNEKQKQKGKNEKTNIKEKKAIRAGFSCDPSKDRIAVVFLMTASQACNTQVYTAHWPENHICGPVFPFNLAASPVVASVQCPRANSSETVK